MMGATFMLSAEAEQDILTAVRYYLARGGKQAALGFHRVLAEAMSRLARMPGLGSPRWGAALGIPELRFWPLRRYPWLLFYNDGVALLLLLRVLHERRRLLRPLVVA